MIYSSLKLRKHVQALHNFCHMKSQCYCRVKAKTQLVIFFAKYSANMLMISLHDFISITTCNLFILHRNRGKVQNMRQSR